MKPPAGLSPRKHETGQKCYRCNDRRFIPVPFGGVGPLEWEPCPICNCED